MSDGFGHPHRCCADLVGMEMEGGRPLPAVGWGHSLPMLENLGVVGTCGHRDGLAWGHGCTPGPLPTAQQGCKGAQRAGEQPVAPTRSFFTSICLASFVDCQEP